MDHARILATINSHRRRHRVGDLQWDSSCANQAQRWANAGNYVHSGTEGFGECLYISTDSRSADATNACISAINAWQVSNRYKMKAQNLGVRPFPRGQVLRIYSMIPIFCIAPRPCRPVLHGNTELWCICFNLSMQTTHKCTARLRRETSIASVKKNPSRYRSVLNELASYCTAHLRHNATKHKSSSSTPDENLRRPRLGGVYTVQITG